MFPIKVLRKRILLDEGWFMFKCKIAHGIEDLHSNSMFVSAICSYHIISCVIHFWLNMFVISIVY